MNECKAIRHFYRIVYNNAAQIRLLTNFILKMLVSSPETKRLETHNLKQVQSAENYQLKNILCKFPAVLFFNYNNQGDEHIANLCVLKTGFSVNIGFEPLLIVWDYKTSFN